MTKGRTRSALAVGICLVTVSLFSNVRNALSTVDPGSVVESSTNHVVSVHEINSKGPRFPAFVFVLKTSGMGSQLLNFFAQAIYFEEFEKRSMIIDEATYQYRFNESVGLFTAYFTPKFPVIDTVEQQQKWIEPWFSRGHNYTAWRNTIKPGRWKGNVKHDSSSPSPVVVSSLYSARSRIMKNYNASSLDFYHKMVDKACPNLQINDYTRRRMMALKRKHNIPEFTGTSAAFHIRRGDKVRKESKAYSGQEYLQTLRAKAPGVSFEDCFVASDSYSSVTEIRAALEAENWRTCQRLWTLTHPNEEGFYFDEKEHSDESTLQFLTELQIMTETDYFVGTFGSNVGGLTTVLRGCNGRRLSGDHPYANSYGVDGDYWYLR